MMTTLAKRRIHFMGIGGVGMSALAAWARARGAEVSGCDREASEATDRLEAAGIPVAIGHDPAHAAEADLLVYTSAVPKEHPERRAADGRAERRGSFLARLAEGYRVLGVCGTHGKTTTSWILAHLLLRAQMDPTIFVGGHVGELGGNFRLGDSDLLVAELDESDASFLEPTLDTAILTNVEADHMAHYGDFEAVRAAFARFAAQVEASGKLIASYDDPEARDLWEKHAGKKVSAGLLAGADVRAFGVFVTGTEHSFRLVVNGRDLGRCSLSLWGAHNIRNALLAAAAALALGVKPSVVRAGLADCTPVARRMSLAGEAGGIRVYDDYAHHPTEIVATLRGAREHLHARLVVIYQPHLYSRTRDFEHEIGAALAEADEVLLAPIYPAREEAIPGVNSGRVVAAVREAGGRADGPFSLEELPRRTAARLLPGDVVICMGAGDIWKVSDGLLRILDASG